MSNGKTLKERILIIETKVNHLIKLVYTLGAVIVAHMGITNLDVVTAALG